MEPNVSSFVHVLRSYLCVKFLQSKCIVLYIYTPGSKLTGVECTIQKVELKADGVC